MADIERPEAWKLGWVDAHEYEEPGNPFPPEDPDHYAWAAGLQAGLKARLPAGNLGLGKLWRDSQGEYWFWSQSAGVVRCLSDEGTGIWGGYGASTSNEAAKELLKGGYFCNDLIRTLDWDAAWTLRKEG
jgi:hypothetical protein